jgi:hypothetical protein
MIQLTPRDIRIVNFLRDQGFATYDDLRIRFFGKKSVTSRRLRILSDNGIIKAQNIYEIFGLDRNTRYFPYLVQLKINPKHRIFTLGESMLRSLNFGKTMQRKDMVFHQLFLNHVLYFVEKAFPGAVVVTEQMINALSMNEPGRKKEIAPDMAVEFEKNGYRFKIAVELERTIKDRNRYLQKSDHLDRSIYTHVWYVGLSDKSLKTLQSKMVARRKYGFSHISNLERVLSPDLGILSFMGWLEKVKVCATEEMNSSHSLKARMERIRWSENDER